MEAVRFKAYVKARSLIITVACPDRPLARATNAEVARAIHELAVEVRKHQTRAEIEKANSTFS